MRAKVYRNTQPPASAQTETKEEKPKRRKKKADTEDE